MARVLIFGGHGKVALLLEPLLVAQGHTVLEASHGAEAIAVVRMRRGNLDLVLADVVMPEMNGTELAATLVRNYPGLPVILMSAYAPAGLTQVGPERHKVPVLQKPFSTGQLEEMIQVTLEMQGRRRRDGRHAAALPLP
jgi:CheY-like chemotaxis protein